MTSRTMFPDPSADALDAEMDALAEKIAALCAGRHRTIVLGAMASVIWPLIEGIPDRAYAYAAADAFGSMANELKRRMQC